nr:reverse transcriptase domain-containing protein [Tanacetum cinerariifolium]
MTKDLSIPKRNKVNWHYVRDDQMFMTIKLVLRHQMTQQFGAILPIELTNEDIINSAAYKEYFVVASGAAPPKTKASVRKTQSSSYTTITPLMAAGTRLSTSARGKQPAKSSKAKGLYVLSEVAMTEAEQIKLAMKRSLQQAHISQDNGSSVDEGTSILPGVPDVPIDESDEEISWKSSDEDDDDEVDERSNDQEDEDDQDDDDQNDDDQDDNDDDQDTSRNNSPQREASPAIVEPLRIELPFLEDQFQEDTPPESPMANNRTMAELLQAPTEGYEDAIVILEITANNFELKHGLINLAQNKQFFGHDKEDPHAHIRYFNKITSTIRVPNVPSSLIKLMLFPFSLEGASQIWLEKEPPRSTEGMSTSWIFRVASTRHILQCPERQRSRFIELCCGTLKDGGEGTYFQLSQRFIAACSYLTIKNKDLMKAQALKISPIDYAHPFVSPPVGDQNNLNIPTKKPTPHVIPYCRFTKLIIFYLGSKHNIYKRHGSSVHITGDDFLLGNLKFVPKGEKDEVFRKSIPKELITKAIQYLSYYQQYWEMVARKPTTKEDGQNKTASKADKPTLVKKPPPAKQTKLMIEKSTKPIPSKKASKGKVMKVQKGKRSDRLVDEADEEPQPAPEPQIEDDEYNLKRSIQMSLDSFQAPISGVAIHEPTSPKKKSTTDQNILQRQTLVTEKASTRPSAQPQDDTSANVVRVSNTLESRPPPDEDQAGSNPGQSHVALARPNPKPMHEDFISTVYLKVYESLKHTTKEQVFLENLPSSSGTLLSMKNLDDSFTFELLEFKMKETLHDRMFKSGSYRSQPKHVALYKALEASMDRENREEFVQATTKSCKKRHDDQDPPSPPSKESDQNKKKKHDFDASASKQPQA